MRLADAFIVDIDGTLTDCEHRRHWIDKQPKNWEAFLKACPLDTPIYPVIRMVQSLYSNGYRIILCSGRDSEYNKETIAWMLKYDVEYHELHMRARRDFRSDSVVKKEMLDDIKTRYNIIGVIDDRKKVVDMWRENGLFVFDVNQTGKDF